MLKKDTLVTGANGCQILFWFRGPQQTKFCHDENKAKKEKARCLRKLKERESMEISNILRTIN